MKNNSIYTVIIWVFLITFGVQAQTTPVNVTIANKTITSASTAADRMPRASNAIIIKPNTWIKSGTTFSAKIIIPTYYPLSDQNYVWQRTPQKEYTTLPNTIGNDNIHENVTYFDGLGRPIQQIAVRASFNKKDIVTHSTYDDFGRQSKEYLPFESSTIAGKFKTGDLDQIIKTYYKNRYSEDFSGMLDADLNPYSEQVFENSPLNRVLEQGAPGKAWKADSINDTDHTIKFGWATNTATEVVHFKVTFTGNDTEQPQLVKSGHYPANGLHVSSIKDENWQPTQTYLNDHTTKEYKDKQGRVLLKRTYANNLAHDTYYVYDDFGNLTYVIPPKVTTGDGVSAIELSELCYQYKYDHRNRLIEKKIPGKGWEYIVYNKLDQPILTQDALLKEENQWLFTKYDAFGRVAYTGKITITATTRDQLQTEANNFTADLWVVASKTATTIGGISLYYDDGGYPKVTTAEVLTINYYDNYDFIGTTPAQPFVQPATVYGEPTVNTTKSLPTGSKVKVLDMNQWITSVSYYDQKGRAIYIASTNEYLSTTDVTESEFDFVGKVKQSKTSHTKGANTAIVTLDTFTYDHMGRLLTQTQKINEQTPETIVSNTYDALGQLASKKVGGGLQDIAYDYNVRGWLKSINKGTTANGDLFGFKINYNTSTHNATPLFNGNIAETEWKTANDHTQRWYTYSYDALNRINSATGNTTNYNLSNVTYDKMGNIESLTRNGFQNGANYTGMDILTYHYNEGNTLQKVVDTGNKTFGFKDGTNTNDDYIYDANGNMITDFNKGITGIIYNHLNLPETIRISNTTGTGNITYIYDATGVKLKKIVTEGSSSTETDYTGNYVYKNGTLEFFSTPEGYVEKEADGYKYVYQYKDHLGNIRLSYKDADKNGSITQSEIVQEKNYYPFGLQHQYGANHPNSMVNGRKHNYSFNGKEFEQSLDLNTFDLGARQYDPTIGRFMVVDPMADFINNESPYSLANNNPIQFIDDFGFGKCGWLCRTVNKILFGKNNLLPDGTREKKFSRATGNRRNNEKKKKGTINRTDPPGTVQKDAYAVTNFNPVSIVAQPLELPQLSLPDIQTPNPRQPAIPQFEGREFRTRINVPTHIQFTGDGTNLAIDAMTKRTLNAIIKTLVDYPQVKLEVYVNYTGVNSLRNDPNFEQRARSQSSKRGRKIVEFLVRRGVSPGRVRARQGEVIFEKRKQGNTRRNTQNFRIINPKQ
ncbi:DUF6443 domain-containing protein [Aquimarina sp. I32.4]|uniref:DUF6443 domain-containing protein n=1 Tax=Aquimarina sp. I32.4 TaxID=2053903 RepID=UPI000CDEBE60|nr:DUF6443 domain-containing protein [Aquimarina sp. I32.4]